MGDLNLVYLVMSLLYLLGPFIKCVLGGLILVFELRLLTKSPLKKVTIGNVFRGLFAIGLIILGLVWRFQAVQFMFVFQDLFWAMINHWETGLVFFEITVFVLYALALVLMSWQLRLMKRLKGLPQTRGQSSKKSGQKAKATKPSPKPLAQAKSNQEKASRSKLPEPEQAHASSSAPLQNRSQEHSPSVHQPATQSGSSPTVLPQASNQDLPKSDRQQVIDGAQPRDFEPVLTDLLDLVGDSNAAVYYRSHVDSMTIYLPKIQSNLDRLSRQGDQERVTALETELGATLSTLQQLVDDLQADASVERIDQLNEIRYQLQRLT